MKTKIESLATKTISTSRKLIEHEKRPIPSANKSKQRSFKPMTVWDKHLFVIGDNREYSIHSRDFGIIPYKDIVGKVILIYYPYGRIKKT